MTHYYVDPEHMIVHHQCLWSFLCFDEPLTDDDFRGDTEEFPTPLEETLEALEDEPPIEDADLWDGD